MLSPASAAAREQGRHLHGGLVGPEAAALRARGPHGVREGGPDPHGRRRVLAAPDRVPPGVRPGRAARRCAAGRTSIPAGRSRAAARLVRRNRSGLVVAETIAPRNRMITLPSEPGLARPGPADEQDVFLDRLPQPVPVVGPAEVHRVAGRAHDPLPARQRRPGAPRLAVRSPAAPVPPQLRQAREAAPGVQAQGSRAAAWSGCGTGVRTAPG